jgi:hypothetical protein
MKNIQHTVSSSLSISYPQLLILTVKPIVRASAASLNTWSNNAIILVLKALLNWEGRTLATTGGFDFDPFTLEQASRPYPVP